MMRREALLGTEEAEPDSEDDDARQSARQQ